MTLATRPGGRTLVTNHVAQVNRLTRSPIPTRTAEKAGRPLQSAAFLDPEEDLPSLDGCPS